MLKRLALLSLLLILPTAALAAGSAFATPYDIEIVIFERFGNENSEHWAQDPGAPDIGKAVGDLSRAALSGPQAVVLDADSRQLGPAAYTLKRRGAVVHAHQRWRQDVADRNSPNWYRIGNQTVNGLIRVTRGRYLHLDTDLLLQRPGTSQSWRIQLHRRMRSGELHYVDHPMLGILIRADRVESDPLPGETQPETTEPDTLPQQLPADDGGQPESHQGDMPRAMPDPT